MKSPRIFGGEVQHLVQGAVVLTRVIAERMVDDDRDATETVDFSYRGADYQIDLSAANARALDKLLAPILEVSRRPEERPAARRRPDPKTTGSTPAPAAIRAWAKSQGIVVSGRGRVPADVVKRYQDAHRR